MKLSKSERETLIGPAMVGSIVGIFAAVCTIAFNSEYGSVTLSEWPTARDAMLSFLAGLFLAFFPFGVAPVLIARFHAYGRNKSN